MYDIRVNIFKFRIIPIPGGPESGVPLMDAEKPDGGVTIMPPGAYLSILLLYPTTRFLCFVMHSISMSIPSSVYVDVSKLVIYEYRYLSTIDLFNEPI